MGVLPPGVSGNNGLVLNKNQIGFAGQLRRAVPGAIPLHVTSATRTAFKQASALVVKRNLGDNLYKLYKADYIVKELMAVPNTVTAMAAVIQKWANQGHFMSRHMRGDALDIRSKTLTSAQIQAVMAAAKRLGARAIYETKPPHIHVEAIGNAFSDALLAAKDATKRVPRAIRGRSQSTRRRTRRTRRTLALYKRQRVLYTIGAGAVSVVVLLALAAALSKKSKPQKEYRK